MAMKKCPVCGVSVKDENLVRHVRNQHPHEKVEGLEQMAPARKKAVRDWKDDLARLGILIAVAGIVWLVLALLIPSPVGVLVPVFPGLFLLLVVGLGLLAGGWVLGSAAFQRSGLKLAAIGVVLGLALAGSVAFLATQQGIPILSPPTRSEPGGWQYAPNSLWSANHLPVVFYYGSAGCPYCAASSWALQMALQAFGSVVGATYTTSSPTDVYPNTPEVELAHVTYSSSYVSLNLLAGDNNLVISAPDPSPLQRAYLVQYDASGGGFSFPFYVVGGMYIHAGALVLPTVFESGSTTLTPQQVVSALASGSGSVYDAVHSAAVYFEAYMVKACEVAGITPPAAVLGDAAVQNVLAQIT